MGLRLVCISLLALLMLAQSTEVQEQTCTADGTCTSTATDTDPNCVDQQELCGFWAESGECEKNPSYMLIYCEKSCNVCGKQKKARTKEGYLYGVAQETSGQRTAEVVERVKEVEQYISNTVWRDPKYDKVKTECQNRHELCTFWSVIGECEKNPPYMTKECAAACKTCLNLDFDHRCPFAPDLPKVWQPGSLNSMFERIVTEDWYKQYEPKVLMKPELRPEDPYDLPTGPWVVTLEKFLSDEECDKLIELGRVQGYEQSYDVGQKKFDGTYDKYLNSGRTSKNAWCVDACFNDTVTQRVLERMENVTAIPDVNSEYLQILQYEVGQRYMEHHDYIEYQRDRAEGVRLLTVFLYLNDVPAGGGTDFPKLGLTVMPKKGRALIWPSVLDEKPDHKDARTNHQALAVEEGVKYGANAWIHQSDFKEPYARGCI